MRLVLLTKSMLLVLLLNGAAISCAKAAGLALGVEQSGSIMHRTDLSWGVPFSLQSMPARLPGASGSSFLSNLSREHNVMRGSGGFASEWLLRDGLKAADKSSHLLGSWARAGSFEGLISVLVEGRIRLGLHTQGMGLTAPSVLHVAQPNAVPLPAAAWLFASALLGFIVVASRRKV